MKLAIADPPYLGRANVWYGDGMHISRLGKSHGGTGIGGPKPADYHEDAHMWDKLETHAQLVADLIKNYDGWAIAMAHDNLRDYFGIIPKSVPVRVCIWRKTQNMPSGARVQNTYEPVLVRIPDGRKAAKGHTFFPKDCVEIARINNGFPGAKPPAWTRWVLDLLGYDPDTDQVTDLFAGSGAVSQELAQGVLL